MKAIGPNNLSFLAFWCLRLSIYLRYLQVLFLTSHLATMLSRSIVAGLLMATAAMALTPIDENFYYLGGDLPNSPPLGRSPLLLFWDDFQPLSACLPTYLKYHNGYLKYHNGRRHNNLKGYLSSLIKEKWFLCGETSRHNTRSSRRNTRDRQGNSPVLPT